MSGFGKLSSLPAEVRSKIWQTLPVDSFIQALRTSRQVYDEVSKEYYARDFVIRVKGITEPDAQLIGRCSSCKCKREIEWSSFGVLTGCLPCLYAYGKSRYGCQINCTMPLDKFRKTVIEVYPPDRRDPGQLFRLWSGLLQVVRQISRSPGQRVHVYFKEDGQHTWFVSHNGEGPEVKRVQRSIPSGPKTDLDYLLPLCMFLSNAQECTIVVPPTSTQDTFLHLAAIAQSAGDIATQPDADPPMSFFHGDDRMVGFNWQTGFHTFVYPTAQYLEIEQILDDLEGPTASLIRRDRFAKWIHYESRIYNLLAPSRIRLRDLYRDRLMWDKATAWQPDEEQKTWLSVGDKFWESWEDDWPDGIPPKSSPEWQAQMDLWPEFFHEPFGISYDLGHTNLGLIPVERFGSFGPYRSLLCESSRFSG